MPSDTFYWPAWNELGEPCWMSVTHQGLVRFNSAEFPRVFLVDTGYVQPVEVTDLHIFWVRWTARRKSHRR